ncbi:aldehyde dehydrogenase [Vararia minispora EC-137]|uniref:Aldehyde dehydrogenase n=1 Tax=Vararia minispora EC-137 TaxID=1314806 RepID=A0ACB8Q5C5_9AGAM|nr:aldehyde dehydrogenase [Vararia minispora EC-137]
MPPSDTVQLYIDGKWRPSRTGGTFEVRSTFSGDVVTTSASASLEDCIEAIESAHRAQPAWEALGPIGRQELFFKVAAVMETEEWKESVRQAMIAETSSTPPWLAYHVRGGPMVRSWTALVADLKGETFPSAVPGGNVIVQRRAHGVVYSVIPWNGPISLAIRGTVVPAICGNTVVMRPSEFSPRILATCIEAFHKAGIPPGVINFIPMSQQDTPKLTTDIIAHPLVRTITFTGSDRVGRIIASEAGKYLKPCIFELGGKAPSIVLDDADIEQCARGLLYGGIINSGQVCMSTERVIVQEGVAQALLAAIKTHVASITTGDPKQSAISSLFTEASAKNFIGLLQEAKDAGAEVIVGDLERDGALVRPHILVGVKKGMRLWKQESFGPVLSVAVADSVEHAIELANDTEYSLTSSLWTRDIYRAMDVAARMRAGSVNINGTTINSEPLVGLAGLGGGSGYGRFDVEHFTDKRVLTLHPPSREYPGFLPPL